MQGRSFGSFLLIVCLLVIVGLFAHNQTQDTRSAVEGRSLASDTTKAASYAPFPDIAVGDQWTPRGSTDSGILRFNGAPESKHVQPMFSQIDGDTFEWHFAILRPSGVYDCLAVIVDRPSNSVAHLHSYTSDRLLTAQDFAQTYGALFATARENYPAPLAQRVAFAGR